MKTLMIMGLFGVALAIPAQADVRSYCEAYARNQADVRLSGSAILGAKPKLTPEEWEERKTLALADCLTLYTTDAASETVAVAEPEPTVTAKPKATAVKAKPKAAAVKARRGPTLLARRTAPAQEESTASTSGLVRGSRAWEDYCAAKYASFNRQTGTYKSYSGKQKPCLVTKS